MVLRIGSNISSLQAQRRLAENSSQLSKTFEHLSSGQRINRASDDAASLSVADSLGAGRRVYVQGVRNINDGISALQIADSTIGNLSQIVTRIRELAEQSANGTLSAAQRRAIDKEAKALQSEYFRISRETSFNRMKLFDGSLANGLRLQAGFGADGSIQSSLGGVMGDGTFGSARVGSNGVVALGDLNGDGILDMVNTASYGSGAGVLFGNGDGTFQAARTYASGSSIASIALGDANGDGVLDIFSASNGGGVSVLIGQGDGTFQTARSFGTGSGSTPLSIALNDLNGDGVLDIVTSNYSGEISALLGNGDGTFKTAKTFSTGNSMAGVALGDVNSDGVLDVVASNRSGAEGAVTLLIGNGDGTFKTAQSVGPMDDNMEALALGDLNGDGNLDIVTARYTGGQVGVFLGNGNGTFRTEQKYKAGDITQAVALGDVNGDGVLDIVAGNDVSNDASVLLGNGDGTFKAAANYGLGATPYSVKLGDLNGDGVLDIATGSVLLGDTREGVAPLLPFSLTTQADALQALAPLERKINQLSAQRGIIGAFQSRLGSALGTLQSTSENYAAAESRIRDADIALEAGQLTRLQISQQAATAVLAQANQQPALAIQLLRNG
jgi:flagellin-like hook-associated protein FlgL